MSSLTLEEAQSRLREVVTRLVPGEEILITNGDLPVARLVGEWQSARQPRQPGSAKGILTILVDDDEHLNDFAEYMP